MRHRIRLPLHVQDASGLADHLLEMSRLMAGTARAQASVLASAAGVLRIRTLGGALASLVAEAEAETDAERRGAIQGCIDAVRRIAECSREMA